jgi:hypothetical protein
MPIDVFRPVKFSISRILVNAVGKELLSSLLALLLFSCGGGGGNSSPQAQVTLSNDPTPGYIYFTPQPYIIIMDTTGQVKFSKNVSGVAGFDFKIQPNGAISFYTETSGGTGFYFTDGFITAMNSNYQVAGIFRVPGGDTDAHDSLMLPNGNIIMLSYQDVIMDLTQFGGSPSAIVTDIHIVEIDSSGTIIFEWKGLDHFQITETTPDITLQATPPNKIDYAHANSIDVATDGNLILSCRHLDAVVKINYQTGDIIWRLGGKKSDFVFPNDSLGGPSHQHCARMLSNGNLLMFDNGNLHNPPVSRAIEYQLNETSAPKAATLVWQFMNDPPLFSVFTGSVQRLANGNTFIGWGAISNPAATEVMPDGTKVFEMALPAGITSYRAFKFDR